VHLPALCDAGPVQLLESTQGTVGVDKVDKADTPAGSQAGRKQAGEWKPPALDNGASWFTTSKGSLNVRCTGCCPAQHSLPRSTLKHKRETVCSI
jgi:hypothetical protein